MFGGGVPRLARLAAVLACALGAQAAPAGAAVVLRGLEAPSLHGSGRFIADPNAPDGESLVLSAGQVGWARVDTVAARAVEVTAAGGCRGKSLLSVMVGQRRARTISLSGTGWTHRTLALRLGAGRRLIALTPITSTRGARCRSVSIDRVDFLPRSSADDVLLGTAVRAADLYSNPLYQSALLANFDSITPENEMQMGWTDPDSGDYSLRTADGMVNFAVAHGMQVRGHALVWGDEMPSWFVDPLLPWSSSAVLATMRSYITMMVTHFAGRVGTWDVVNDAFNANGTYTRNLWFNALGPSYIADAFRFAAAADPAAQLYYNDGADVSGPQQDAVLAMVRSLRAEGVPIDGVGFETHVPVGGSVDEKALEGTFERFAALGVSVEITEMDVPLPLDGHPPTAAQLAAQALVYHNAATACWDIAACRSFTTWGFTDAVTWLGSAAAPLLFNTAYDAKPALFAVEQALHRG